MSNIVFRSGVAHINISGSFSTSPFRRDFFSSYVYVKVLLYDPWEVTDRKKGINAKQSNMIAGESDHLKSLLCIA